MSINTRPIRTHWGRATINQRPVPTSNIPARFFDMRLAHLPTVPVGGYPAGLNSNMRIEPIGGTLQRQPILVRDPR